MSQENVEVIRRGYELLNKWDIDAWLEGFHPDAEVHDLAGIPTLPSAAATLRCGSGSP